MGGHRGKTSPANALLGPALKQLSVLVLLEGGQAGHSAWGGFAPRPPGPRKVLRGPEQERDCLYILSLSCSGDKGKRGLQPHRMCLCVCLCMHLCVCVCLSVSVYLCLSVCLRVCVSVCLCVVDGEGHGRVVTSGPWAQGCAGLEGQPSPHRCPTGVMT